MKRLLSQHQPKIKSRKQTLLSKYVYEKNFKGY